MGFSDKKIAIIGSGIAGLSAAHVLQKKYQITLFEKNNKLGGHTNTHTISSGIDEGLEIDTGFIVMNHKNYPLLSKLFDQLNINLHSTNMSFSYHDTVTDLQYSGSGLNGLFGQRKNLLNPSFYFMVKEILRFYKIAKEDLCNNNFNNNSLNEYLKKYNFSNNFIKHHLIPMGSSIWSTPCKDMDNFPAHNFINFLNNHGLLSINERPKWKTVVGGSNTYIKRMLNEWKNVEINLKAKIESIKRFDNHVEIFCNNKLFLFDDVIIATHANQVLDLLGDADEKEQELFKHWKYAKSKVYLHTDKSVMPPLKNIWSSWNFKRLNDYKSSLTYYMNSLQPLKTESNYFVSLDLPEEPKNIIYEVNYEHPIFTNKVVDQREELINRNGTNNTWFTGSYLGNGFHEDGIKSSMDVALKIGMIYE